MRNSSSSSWKGLIIIILITSVSFAVYRLYDNQKFLKGELHHLLDAIYSPQIKEKEQAKVKDALLKVGDSSLAQPAKVRSWLEIQKKSKDTVVQVHVQISHFNWIEPYKTPGQSEATGTGFFINEKGHILTNSHVVEDATTIHVKIPSLGQEMFEVQIIAASPERDVAILEFSDKVLEEVKGGLGGKIPYLNFGDSDIVLRTQKIMVLGYPLSLPTLKSTHGIVSGRERLGSQSYLQITAPINPGNSGGPALNSYGEVVGISTAGFVGAQNMGYIIPISEVRAAINDLYKVAKLPVKLLRKPLLGALFTNSTKDLARYLGNPGECGWYIPQVGGGSVLEKNGVKAGDMLYEINGYKLDRFGDITVPWSEDKVSILTLLNRMVVGDEVNLVIYRNGKREKIKFNLEPQSILPVRKVLPCFEKIVYEVIGGMVVMELTMNHVVLLVERAPFLMRYTKLEHQYKPRLIITHILPNSQAYKAQTLTPGSILDEINGEPVYSINEFREAAQKSKKTGFLTVKTFDGVVDKMFAALSLDKIFEDEDGLSSRYFYKKSSILDVLK